MMRFFGLHYDQTSKEFEQNIPRRVLFVLLTIFAGFLIVYVAAWLS